MTAITAKLVVLGLVALGACRADSGELPAALEDGRGLRPSYDEQQLSDWSAPVNLGSPVNSTLAEVGAFISRDGLSLYFGRIDHPDDFGGNDIVVSRRATVGDPWGPPQNLGPAINTEFDEQAPSLSLDGHRLFFNSNRPDGFGGQDLYVSRRRNSRDDFDWGPTVNLGDGVNTPANEAQPAHFEDDATGTVTLFFTSNRVGTDDIYASTLLPDETFGPPLRIEELSSPQIDRQPAIRRDGLEMFLASNRPGTVGGLDLWVSTRASTSDPWSTPVNLGPVVNSTLVDGRPALSFDGTELYFQSNANRPGATGPCFGELGPCFFDLYVTTRSKLR